MSNIRRTPQQSRSQRRKEALLNAMAALLNQMDYAEISVAEIARHAETSVGSLYQYFPTKDALLQALVEGYVRDMQQLCREIFTLPPEKPPLEEAYHTAMDHLIAYAVAHPGFKVILKSNIVTPEIQAHVDQLFTDMFNGIIHVVLYYAPHTPPLDSQCAAEIIMALVDGILPRLTEMNAEEQTVLIKHFKQAGLVYLQTVIAENTPQ